MQQDHRRLPLTPLDDSKVAIRRLMRKRRAQLSSEERLTFSLSMVKHLMDWLESQLFKPGTRIALYAARADEPCLDAAATLIEARKWRAFWPILSSDGSNLVFAPEPSPGALVMGQWGIRQPADLSASCPADDLVVCCMPGLAFGPSGERVGSGKGLYDRTFAGLHGKIPHRIGVGFAFQTLPAVATLPHDISCSWHLDEHGVRRCGLSKVF